MKAITIIKIKNGFAVREHEDATCVIEGVSLDELRFFGELGDTGFSDRHLTNYIREWKDALKDMPDVKPGRVVDVVG